MIVHTVMFKIKDDDRTKGANARKVKDLLESMKGKVPDIRRMDVGVNCVPSDRAWDVVLRAEFEDESALKRYQTHPEHLKLSEQIKSMRENIAVVDYVPAG